MTYMGSYSIGPILSSHLRAREPTWGHQRRVEGENRLYGEISVLNTVDVVVALWGGSTDNIKRY